jgi:hypothetical protein
MKKIGDNLKLEILQEKIKNRNFGPAGTTVSRD